MKEQIQQGDESVLKEHGLVGMPRPRAARYLDVHPGKPAIELRSGPLGPPHGTADKPMARYYEETMRRITKPSSVLRRLAGVAFWPDESGLLVARVVMRKGDGRMTATWLGLNAREMYVAGVIGIGLTPDALIRKLDEEAGR